MSVYVVGNVTEDLVFTLPRLPRPGETLIARDRLADIGGKGLNQALILARAGCDVRLVSAVGEDEAGRRARTLVDREIRGSALTVVDGATDQSIIYVAEDGENHIVSSAFAAGALGPADVRAALAGIGPDDALLVQGNLGAETTAEALAAARGAGAWTVANPSPIRWSWRALWPLTDLVVLNRGELAELSGVDDEGAGVAALRGAGAGTVLVTLGGGGARLHGADGVASVPAAPACVVDTAGAGDTFCSVFVAASLGGAGPAAALATAARAAALTVSRRGTLSAFPSRAELAACLADAGASA